MTGGMPLHSSVTDILRPTYWATWVEMGSLERGEIPSVHHLEERQVLTQETWPFRRPWAGGGWSFHLLWASPLGVDKKSQGPEGPGIKGQ